MSVVDRIVGAVTGHTRIAIAVMIVLTVIVGAGAGAVEQKSSLEQFQSDTPEAKASEYIDDNFQTGPENATRVQVIVRGDNVLSNESLVGMLEYQQRLRNDPEVNGTLINASVTPPSVGVANILGRSAVRQQTIMRTQRTLDGYPFLNASGEPDQALLASIQAQLRDRRTTLNATGKRLQQGLKRAQDPNVTARTAFDRVNANTTIELDEEDYQIFERTVTELGNATGDERGDVIRNGVRDILSGEIRSLQEATATLQELTRQLEPGSSPSLQEQIDAIRSLDASQLDALIASALGGGPASEDALVFMPVGYDPGSTTANATTMLITQRTEVQAVGGTATEEITDSQLAMQDISGTESSDLEYVVFGVGIINDEINQSMTDSMVIVGPLALLFVLLALAIGYRDLLDIVLGVVGIFTVLLWTFGFMGWRGIDFNQIFIAVPVLLIGLSIDYAIHIFMRHREERFEMGNGDLRGSMRVALGGVGVALALVTATTVIGFLSNLVSPLPPIQDFGVVSSFGIVAAFLVFGVLTPALKIEIDSFLESRGIDRKKRAIGTGGGRLSSALKIGSLGAKQSAYAVIALALVISAAGAYGGSQVDTSFAQEDFLAEDPPDWLQDLPEPFAPGDYTAKENLEYVNENFQRQDAKASILIRGDVAADSTLADLQSAQTDLAAKNVTQRLPNGEASIDTPLTVINETRQGNPAFNETVAANDANDDGIPDENLTAVYDALFEANPQEAGAVLSRTDGGEYEAARLVVNLKGTASGAVVIDQLRSVANGAEQDQFEQVIATGQPIVFEIVQKQLLDTVIESLLITLVAVFAFLMVVYRVTDGSATLGFVTLIPVALSVSWILGTMYLVGIPFNVLTGMITSLTVGLGVAYSIHISERYNQELERTESAWTALDRAVTGTGGALLGSAATTVGGFGTLAVALLPSLQQFGIITGLTIIYAFLASVLVLPSLLIVWTRFVGPAEKLDVAASEGTTDGLTTDD